MKISKLLKMLLMPFRFYAVEEDEDGNVLGTENDKRLKMYQQIADNNDKGRSEEFYEVDEDGNQTGLSLDDVKDDGTLGIVEEDEIDEETEEPEETPEIPVESLTKESRKYKITVNGVTKEVDEDWLVQTAQKVDSADDYLREAARLNQDARTLTKPTPTEETREEEPDEVQLARAIQMGTEEEAVAAIRKLRSPTGPSNDDLARTIDERLTFQKAVDWFKSEYEDIISDPVLNALAVQQDNMLRAQGDKRSYEERFKGIGEGIRDWLKGKSPAPQAAITEPETKVQTTVDKKARKAAAPQVPKPAANKVTHPEEDDEEESIQDTIANMAKNRGGPQWLRG